MRRMILVGVLCLGGCSPLRHYRMAGDKGEGDLTHVSEPGARVVVPKNPPKQQVKYLRSPYRPGVNCVEIDHKVEEYVRTWACSS